MEDAPKLLKIPKSECPDIWISPPRRKWPKSWSSMEDPVVPLERNLYGHPLAGLSWERQFEKIQFKHGWDKVSNWNAYSYNVKKGYSHLCMWMTSSWLERNKTLIRCGKYSIKKSGEPTSFLDHVYLVRTQRQCETSKDNNHRAMFESRISAEGIEKLPYSDNFRISSWSYDMEGHAKKCVERYCELANRTTRATLQRIYSMHR